MAAEGRRPTLFGTPPSSPEFTYEAFVVIGSPAHRTVVSWIGARLGTVLGLGVAACVVVAPGSAEQRLVTVAIALVGLAAGQLLSRQTLPLWALDLLMAASMGLIAWVGALGGPIYPAVPTLFVVIGTGVFAIRPLRATLLHVALIGVAYGAVLAAGPETTAPVTRWVTVVAAALISGLFVRWMVGQVTTLATLQRSAREDARAATAELEQLSETKSRFLSRMSHELRTPLNVIMGFADVLRDGLVGPLNERQHSYVEDIAMSGRDLLSLVDDLLDVSKIEAGIVDLSLARIDVGRVVTEAEMLVRGRARQAGVSIDVAIEGGPVWAEADALRIRQTCWNLLGNAVKFTPRGGRVSVWVAADGDRVIVAVRDTGTGIAPQDQDRIFQRFERGAATEEGSGIGLSLCRRLVEAHGGRLWLTSAPGRGSTFTFELPLLQPTTPESAPTVVAPGGPMLEDDEAYLSPGSLANRLLMARVGQWFGVAAATLLSVLAVITPGPLWARGAVLGLSLCSLGISVVLDRRRRLVTARASEYLGAFGTVAISACTLVAGPFADLTPLAYGWPVLASAALLAPRKCVSKIVLVGLCFGLVLVIESPSGALQQWVAVMVLLVANAVLLQWIADRLREVMSEALSTRLAAEAMRSQAEAVSAHKSDFLANTSHELCTPLNAIIGFAQVLQDDLAGPLEPRQAAYVEDILASGQHLLALISDLLDLAKLEAGRLPSSRQPVAMAALVHAVVGDLAATARARNVELRVDLPEALPDIDGDPVQLHQALTNLIENGIKFTHDGGSVEVVGRDAHDDGRVLISVRDTGIGILPDQRLLLFDAFHQGSRPLPEHARGGTGLGLTLVKRLVELQGGTISVESTPDIGSTFTVSLPTTPVLAIVDPVMTA